MIFRVAVGKGTKVAAKQTGPARTVKRRDHLNAGIGLLVLALSACAGTPWQQQGKTASDTRRDLAACERNAETATLTGSGTSRADFPLPTTGGRGPSPLEMHDRAELSDRYDRAVDRCMRGLGYGQGHAADRR
jgi:hypothetical protein